MEREMERQINKKGKKVKNIERKAVMDMETARPKADRQADKRKERKNARTTK